MTANESFVDAQADDVAKAAGPPVRLKDPTWNALASAVERAVAG